MDHETPGAALYDKRNESGQSFQTGYFSRNPEKKMRGYHSIQRRRTNLLGSFTTDKTMDKKKIILLFTMRYWQK